MDTALGNKIAIQHWVGQQARFAFEGNDWEQQ